MLPYGYLTGHGSNGSGRHVDILEDRLYELLRSALSEVEVNEDWYCEAYKDVEVAIKAGKFKSATEHYLLAGYFEDRLPHSIEVDEAWYLAQNADVAAAIERGKFFSAQQHFALAGFREGRLPSKGWSLRQYRHARERRGEVSLVSRSR
jgi:hypothetical protein